MGGFTPPGTKCYMKMLGYMYKNKEVVFYVRFSVSWWHFLSVLLFFVHDVYGNWQSRYVHKSGRKSTCLFRKM